MKFTLIFTLLLAFSASHSVRAEEIILENNEEIGEIDPYDANIESELKFNDFIYGSEEPSSFFGFQGAQTLISGECYRQNCQVFAYVSRAQQRISIYIGGRLQGTWPVSTGVEGHGTPGFDKHPDGRIYTRYSSTKYPGGDYKGLGNMPYAVFIAGGFAIHGTPEGNWKNLGRRASHGCIRVHPDVGYMFNRAVREAGVKNTWITVD